MDKKLTSLEMLERCFKAQATLENPSADKEPGFTYMHRPEDVSNHWFQTKRIIWGIPDYATFCFISIKIDKFV